jgi:hypothetical protein
MNQLQDLRETVVDAGPYSFVVLGVAAAALILGVVACVLGHRRRLWKGLPGRLAVAAVSLVLLALGFVVAAAQDRRSVVIDQLLLNSAAVNYGGDATRMVNLGIRVQFAGLVFLGGLMLLALTVVTLGLTLSWRTEAISRRRTLAMSRLRAIALLLPAWPPAAGFLVYGLRMNKGFWGVAGVDPSMKTAELLRSIDGAYPIIEAARIGLLLLVALGAITAVVAWRRGALRPVSSVRLAAGALVFLAGLFAFAASRGQAADRHPLPILPYVADAPYASKVPSVSPCLPLESAPVLKFTNDLVKLDWAPVDPDEFRDRLAALLNNDALLHGGRPMPPLIVEADPATPTDRIIPYLRKVDDMTILVASATSRPFLSKTLGTIARYEFCGRTFRLVYKETATRLDRYRTWSDVAAAVSRNPGILEITVIW